MTDIVYALDKKLTFDMLRQTRISVIICSCDLKSCYDRIVRSFASLVIQMASVPVKLVNNMLSTIQKLKYAVRIYFGDSYLNIGGKECQDLNQLQSVCQGNGAGQ